MCWRRHLDFGPMRGAFIGASGVVQRILTEPLGVAAALRSDGEEKIYADAAEESP
jgi:hypothetical protein